MRGAATPLLSVTVGTADADADAAAAAVAPAAASRSEETRQGDILEAGGGVLVVVGDDCF